MIKSITFNYDAVKSFQKASVSITLEDFSDEELTQWKEWAMQQAVADVSKLAESLPSESKASNKPQNSSTNQFSVRKGNNYPVNANQSPRGNYVKPACSEKQRNVLLQAGYTNEEINSWDAETVKATIAAIFNN